MLYHAFEIATDGSYDLHVAQDENTLSAVLEATKQALATSGEEIDTIAIGTINADSVESALDKIRAGDWDYSQLI